jgi:putative transposase
VSALYMVVCRLLELIVLVGRGDRAKELEILVLRHELSILRRQAGQPRFEVHDRVLLAAFSRMLPRRSWNAFLVRPKTLLHWHRRTLLGAGPIRTAAQAGRPSPRKCAS